MQQQTLLCFSDQTHWNHLVEHQYHLSVLTAAFIHLLNLDSLNSPEDCRLLNTGGHLFHYSGQGELKQVKPVNQELSVSHDSLLPSLSSFNGEHNSLWTENSFNKMQKDACALSDKG